MRLTLTVIDTAAAGATCDVEVVCPAGATAGSLADALGLMLQFPCSPVLFVDSSVLPSTALVGAPPLLHGSVVTLARPPEGSPTSSTGPTRLTGRTSSIPDPLMALAVIGGPDAGRTVPLGPGRHTLGRTTAAGIALEDPALSRRHAAVDVGASGVSVSDLGSTNGTQVDGVAVGRTPTPLRVGQIVTIGSSRLRLTSGLARTAVLQSRGDGTLAVNRGPRRGPSPTGRVVNVPAAPVRPRGLRMPWLALLLPLPVCLLMARFYGPQMLLFAALSPVMMLGQWGSDRWGGRRSYAAQGRAHARAVERAVQETTAALRAEQREVRRTVPDCAEVLMIAVGPTARLWERRATDPDALWLRIGWGDAPASTRVVTEPGVVTEPRLDALSADGPGSVALPGFEPQPTLRDVPVSVSLVEVGVLGVSGDRTRATGHVDQLVGQLAVLRSPTELELRVLAADAAKGHHWQWVSRLPHMPGTGPPHIVVGHSAVSEAVAELVGTLAERGAGAGSAPAPSRRVIVVIVDGAADLRGVAGLARLLSDGPSAGIYVVALDDRRTGLPAEAGTVIEMTPSGEGPDLSAPGRPLDARVEVPATRRPTAVTASSTGVATVVPDVVGSWWCERLSRALAPLRDAAPADTHAVMPSMVRLLDLLPFDGVDPVAISSQWQSGLEPALVLGATASGPHLLDLATDGPHVLVAGTTGAGKSDLLQTLIASLAVTRPPDRLSLVLVDYKGGAAFHDCADLPHVAGVVTDLDSHLAERALVSLRAELARREALLASVGASTLEGYEDSRGDGPRIARLVIIIDEFRLLAQDLPTFIEGIVAIAAIGRSLGVHLVLATQRPGGVVTADIRANVNLRIALRVRDRADSEDVIDGPEAATIGERTPGRAVSRTGGNDAITFQAAWVGGAATEDHAELTVRPLGAGVPAHLPLEPATPLGPTDLTRIVAAVVGAAARWPVPAPRRPWLPPLGPLHALTPEPAGLSLSEGVVLGLADLPAAQRQEPWRWHPLDGSHLAVAGGAGTGRSTLLRCVAGQLATAYSPADVHLYAVEGVAGALRGLSSLPHTGAVVARADPHRLRRLLQRLRREVSRRRTELAASGHASWAEWVRATTHTPSGTPPGPQAVVLLVDGWDLLSSPADSREDDGFADDVLDLIRVGEPVGLRLVVTGDRGILLGRLRSLVATTLLLRLPDPADAALAGVLRSALPRHQPAGRALEVGPGVEIQLGLLGGETSTLGQNRVLAQIGAASRTGAGADVVSQQGGLPWRVDALPQRARLAELCPSVDAGFAVGIGGDDLQTLTWDPARDGRQVLVAGPARSGTTTTLATLAAGWLAAGGRLAVVSGRPGPLDQLVGADGVVAVGPETPERLIEARRSDPGLGVVVDDATDLLDTPVEPVLRDIARLVERDRGLLVCGADSARLAVQFRGVALEVSRRRSGLLLQPSSLADGDLFGIRTHPGERVPGRGLLVRRGTVEEIQVAHLGPLPAETLEDRAQR